MNPMRYLKKIVPNKVKHQLKLFIYKISGKKYVHLIHVGKTGGSAVKHALSKHSVTSKYVIQLHPHETGLRDIPAGEKVIFFVRDPVSRFVSGFYSRKRQGRPLYICKWTPAEEAAFKEFDSANSLAVAISSRDEEKRKRAMAAMKGILHVSSSFWDWFENESYFCSRLSDIFFIGFQEHLASDFELLKTKLGIPENIPLPSDDVQAHRNPVDMDSGLEEEAISNLKKWYAGDYDFINLCKQKRDELNCPVAST